MSEPRVRGVMNPSVVVVTADCTIRHVTDVITELGVSGVPVVDDDDRVIGVVSEADLLPRLDPAGVGTAPLKAGARTARELMTSPPITVRVGAALSTAAGLMLRYRVKRLPVLDDDTGALVGIVTRGDLLRGALHPDEAIEHEVTEEELLRGLWRDPADIGVTAHDGEVALSGGTARQAAGHGAVGRPAGKTAAGD